MLHPIMVPEPPPADRELGQPAPRSTATQSPGADPEPRQTLTYEEYLRVEENSGVKHEWIDGEAFAMAGGSPEHARLQGALTGALTVALAGRPCAVFGADLRIRSRETNIATYADVTVVCGALRTDPDDPHAVTNPVLVIEVLSPSTEAHDRGEKAAHYRRIPSLREYVLVSQDTPRVEVFCRIDGDHWQLIEVGPGGVLHLESVGCTVSIDEIFANPLAGQST